MSGPALFIATKGPRARHRVGALLIGVVTALVASPVLADRDDDDGAASLIRSVKRSRLVDLSHVWEIASPIAGVNPPYSFALSATHANTRGTFGDGGQLSFTSEVQAWSGQHGAPSIDALGHIGRDGKLYGGVDAAKATADSKGIGASGVGGHLAIDRFPDDLLVNRGVLLDVARLVNGDSRPLPDKFEITAAHLQQAAARQRVKLKRGDTVLIRTGWGQYFKGNPNLYKGDNSPGPGLNAADYLIQQGARIVGNDTLTFEQRPPITTTPSFQVFPVHMRLIADAGIFIIENLDLEALSAARAYEFVVVTPPLKISGGTGSALRAFALVPKDD